MSREVKRQLAEIRRQVTRDEIARMRAHLKQRQGRLKELEQQHRATERRRRLDRRARLEQLRIDLSQARKRPVEERRRLLQSLASKRRSFAEWWAKVQAERATRLAEIKSLRAELGAYAKQWPERKRIAVEAITAAVHRELETFDEQTKRQLDSLEEVIDRARRELKREQYDLRTWVRNRGAERRPAMKRGGRVRELNVERDSMVEQNLLTGEELAWWHTNKGQILRQAKEMHITEPDGIAELVREATEGDPDRALEFMQRDADRWLKEELQKEGYAA